MPPSHLVVVCCHGIWIGGPSDGHDEAEWLIADFQQGETPTFIEHIKAGVESVSRTQDAVLVFSGGPTRPETTISEARSYANIAAANSYWGHAISEEHILLEDRALDSYHNLLFSLTLFYTHFSAWPSHMTIVSHGFKRPRLIDGHCSAMGWPLDRVSFVGIDPPSMAASEFGKGDAIKGVAIAVGDWLDDPHGRGEKLKGKRRKRNPHSVWQGVFKQDSKSRQRSQLETTGEGERETLADNAIRPWQSINQTMAN